MLAAAIGYNRREHKPFWWAHFDRLSSALTDWRDERDVFVVESADVITDWAKPTPRSSPHRHVRLIGHWGAGSVVRDGDQVSTVYANPVERGTTYPPTHRWAARAAESWSSPVGTTSTAATSWWSTRR